MALVANFHQSASMVICRHSTGREKKGKKKEKTRGCCACQRRHQPFEIVCLCRPYSCGLFVLTRRGLHAIQPALTKDRIAVG